MGVPITGAPQGLILPVAQKSGAPFAYQSGWHNEYPVSELLPQYSQLVSSGVVFGINFPAAALAAPSATALGAFAFFNPPNSGKVFHLLDIQITLTTWTLVTTTSVAIGLIPIANQTPTSTSNSGISIYNNQIGSGLASKATPFVSGTTVGAPVLASRAVASFVLSTAVGFAPLFAKDDVRGLVQVQPNSGFQIQGLSGTEADVTAIVGLTWAELPG